MQTIKKYWNSIPYWLHGGIIVLILYSVVFVSLGIYSSAHSLLLGPYPIYDLVYITANPVFILSDLLFFYEPSCDTNFIPCIIPGFLEAFILGTIIGWLFGKIQARK